MIRGRGIPRQVMNPSRGRFNSSYRPNNNPSRGRFDSSYQPNNKVVRPKRYVDSVTRPQSCLMKKTGFSLPRFEGKHTRFADNSDDDEIEGEENNLSAAVSPSISCLKGTALEGEPSSKLHVKGKSTPKGEPSSKLPLKGKSKKRKSTKEDEPPLKCTATREVQHSRFSDQEED